MGASGPDEDISGAATDRWRRISAWVALVALVVLVVRFVWIAVQNLLEVVVLLVCLALLPLGAWWAVTSRRAKGVLGAALALVAAVGAVVTVGLLLSNYAREVVLLIFWTVVFMFASSRALDLPSRYRRIRENRVALPATAVTTETPLLPVEQPCALFVNLKSGGGKAEQINLVDRARAMGIRVSVLEPGTDLLELAERAVADGAEVIGMAGGDGSQALVAGVAMAHDLPFVCVPVGTRNHFARDLGLDRQDPLAALAGFGGREIRIDTGRIGGRVFLNNATFGVYADMVHEPGYRDAKLPTAHVVVSEVLNGERPPVALSFDSPSGEHFDSAFLLMVVVGKYSLDTLTDMGVRSSLTDGVLQVSLLEPADERELRRITTAAVLGTLDGADGFWQWTDTELTVTTPTGEVHVGVDGEALTLPSPLTMTVEPSSLRVRLPKQVVPVPGAQGSGLGVTIGDLWSLATG